MVLVTDSSASSAMSDMARGNESLLDHLSLHEGESFSKDAWNGSTYNMNSNNLLHFLLRTGANNAWHIQIHDTTSCARWSSKSQVHM